MKIIRWLLSNSLFILLIVAVIYAYMFWGNLLGKDTPAGKAVAYLSAEFDDVAEFVNAVKTKQALLNEGPSSTPSASTNATVEADTSDSGPVPQKTAAGTEKQEAEYRQEVASKTVGQPVKRPHEMPVAHQPPAVASANMTKSQPGNSGYQQHDAFQPDTPKPQNTGRFYPREWSPQQKPVTTASRQQTDSVGMPQENSPGETGRGAFVSAEVAKQLENVNQRGEVIDPSQPTGAIREKWITARKSFYQRNYELSEKSYKEVINSTKDNFDAYGELGNVYFNQGKHKQAASAYFEAAAILIKNGQVNRASSLMGLMRHLDAAKASELKRLIDNARI